MMLDFNEYYCASNLPLLLRHRDGPGDAQRAAFLNGLLIAQCERLAHREAQDEWLRPTLLAATVRAGDVAGAKRLATRIALDGRDAWKLRTAGDDMRDELALMDDPAKRSAIEAILRSIAPR